MKKLILASVILIAIAIVALGIWFAIKAIPCHWRYSGIESRYRPFVGCQINVGGDIWVPENKYRAIE